MFMWKNVPKFVKSGLYMAKKTIKVYIDEALMNDLKKIYESGSGQEVRKRGYFAKGMTFNMFLNSLISKGLYTEDNKFRLALIRKQQEGKEPDDWSKL